MQIMNIESYYSEDDSVKDGLYTVVYADGKELKNEIERAYDKLNQDGELVKDLAEVLDYLKKKKVVFSYAEIPMEKFDCDYGNFVEA